MFYGVWVIMHVHKTLSCCRAHYVLFEIVSHLKCIALNATAKARAREKKTKFDFEWNDWESKKKHQVYLIYDDEFELSLVRISGSYERDKQTKNALQCMYASVVVHYCHIIAWQFYFTMISAIWLNEIKHTSGDIKKWKSNLFSDGNDWNSHKFVNHIA